MPRKTFSPMACTNFYGPHTKLFISNGPHLNDLTARQRKCIKSPQFRFNFLAVTLLRQWKWCCYWKKESQMGKNGLPTTFTQASQKAKVHSQLLWSLLVELAHSFCAFSPTMLHVAIAAPKNQTLVLTAKMDKKMKRGNTPNISFMAVAQKARNSLTN